LSWTFGVNRKIVHLNLEEAAEGEAVEGEAARVTHKLSLPEIEYNDIIDN
tara:strand:+ start:1360 stop:1509 length:150 start_codon:yes stop_codon:yes gene_type:complete